MDTFFLLHNSGWNAFMYPPLIILIIKSPLFHTTTFLFHYWCHGNGNPLHLVNVYLYVLPPIGSHFSERLLPYWLCSAFGSLQFSYTKKLLGLKTFKLKNKVKVPVSYLAPFNLFSLYFFPLAFVCFIPTSPLPPQSPHCCPCPRVLFPFWWIPPPPNLPHLSCHTALHL